MTDWQPQAATLANKLAAESAISDNQWRAAFEATPRHVFVPRFWELDEYNSPSRLVDGAISTHRPQWLEAAYSDRFLVTRWVPDGGRRAVTSSASLPSLVARMLHVLEVADGHRVLEIGTGTGYNTALLCHRVGAQNVVSVDINAGLVAEAAERLDTIGFAPTVVAGDGALGAEDHGPFDRILATCASRGVPSAWIDQLADGGRIVTPLTIGGALAVLDKTGPGEVSGHLDTDGAWFMPMRPASQPLPDGYLADQPQPAPDDVTHLSVSSLDPEALADPDFRLWLLLHQPQTHFVEHFAPTGLTVHNGVDIATAQQCADGRLQVRQSPRRLWDTVEAAWLSWVNHDKPRRDRLGVTATAGGVQYAWLDHPVHDQRGGGLGGVLRWPLPTSQ
ncbi:methyltransferase domain-containing protein [Salinispora arenicola]|uniref:Protein-L-isoaspartate O-methyltransferase n=1 Tax=Salinispora arenicola TaxID=168697 RepID=A0A542XTK2_SALAC|nr:methyltransferase domain-containing protein [Salinispora arenicola]MCN0154999.1 methyltransferase domain-containing protein [Salinispora arenicola]TQL39162.1 protein-L-isoaspartate(D-aspartate) O-methyltransferase [Salinispora arenicola]GIM88072.1 protein-L-isoaspartate O-methyltransferase [Salinispora arenicola]